MKFLVECSWSGYTPEQRKVCHRSIVGVEQAAVLNLVSSIRFGDGTQMSIAVRRMLPREQVHELRTYDDVLYKAWKKGARGSVSVLEL
jgi:hypothetical protein